MGDEDKIKKKVTNLSKLLKQPDHPNKFYLKIFGKLDGYTMTVGILKETGVGKLINSFKNHESDQIVEMSKQLVRKWKKQVIGSTSSVSEVPAPMKVVKEKPLQVYFYRPNIKKFKTLTQNCVTATTKTVNTWGIYSGAKQAGKMYSMKELAMRVLVQNVDSIYHTGTLTCDDLKPALLKCSAEQLNLIEHRNPAIRGTLESVWEKLVESEFRSNALIGDSWKTMYWDKVIERKEKLKRLTNSIASAKLEKEKADSQVRHLVGPLQPLSKSRGIKRPLNSSSSTGTNKAPLKKLMNSYNASRHRR